MKLRCAAPVAVAALTLPAAGAAAPLQLVLPLRSDLPGLTRFANAVSSPGSPRYGHYASVRWLARRFGASPAARREVVAYLRAHGATDVSADATGQLVRARMRANRAERLFTPAVARGARLVSGEPRAAAQLPRALRRLVTGVIGLDRERVGRQAPAVGSGYEGPDPGASASGCRAGTAEGGFTPNEYLNAYGYTPLHQQGLRGQGERVALVEVDGFRRSDLRTFASCFRLRLPPIHSRAVGISQAPAAGPEATLDVETLVAAAPGLKAIDVYETDPDPADALNALAAPLQDPGAKPQVVSVSFGLCERHMLLSVGKAGIGAMEAVLEVAAAAGVSVLAATGDHGSSDCANPSSGAPLPSLAVSFPASSPWVTAVGGTNVRLNSQNEITDQVVWNDAGANPGLAGGGGLSSLFSRPSWQNGVIRPHRRAVPDVAMLADVLPGYAVYCTAAFNCRGRGWVNLGGTSAATPLLAGGFALVDEQLRRHHRVELGFANPLLYRLGRDRSAATRVFDDVTTGSNDVGPFIQPGGNARGCCSARPGYDAASGWGSVNLAALARSALIAQPKLGAMPAGF